MIRRLAFILLFLLFLYMALSIYSCSPLKSGLRGLNNTMQTLQTGSYHETFIDTKMPETGKTLLIIIDRISLSDLLRADTPNLDSLMEKGGIGLMTTNTGGSRSQKDAYLTMGAGTRVSASDKSPLGLQADETYQGSMAGILYRQITGIAAPEASIVNLGFTQAVRNNVNRPYTVTIGALGTALRQAGIRSAVIGNCDTPGTFKRYLVSLLMDNQGLVPAGIVDQSLLVEAPTRPFGICTDYSKLMQQVNRLWDSTDVFAIQLGDTSRAEDFRYEATDYMNDHYKKTAIEESDVFLGELVRKLDWKRDRILIVTPLGPARDLAENNRLTPVIIAGAGYTKSLLSSASTQRDGIVTNLDIGATILNFYGIPHYGGQLGARIYSSRKVMEPEELLKYNIRLKEINNQRTPLLRSYVTVLIFLLAASLLSIFCFSQFLAYASGFLIFIMAVPVSYLFLPLFHRSAFVGCFLLSWALALIITVLVSMVKRRTISAIGIICLTTAAFIAGDQFIGGRLIAGSPLGYDIISGARYYGMGNEYMGIFIGAVCTGIGAACELLGRKSSSGTVWLSLPLFAVSLLVVAHPGLGANVGGAVSMLFAAASFIILSRKGKISIKHILIVGVAAAAFIIVLFMFDSSRAIDSQSHMGQTVSLIRKNGMFELFHIARRKIDMNIRLFRYTIWTRVFLLSLLTMVLLLFRPVGLLRETAEKYPFFVRGIASGVAGCIIALLTNDSGIVAAGTSMIYLVPPLLMIVINRLNQREVRQLRKEQSG